MAWKTGLLVLTFCACVAQQSGPDAMTQQLTGVWETDCSPTHQKKRIDFTLGVISERQYESDCETENFVSVLTGTITAPNALVDREQIEVDFTLEKAEYAAQNQAAVDNLNQRAYAEISDWLPEEKRDITCRAEIVCRGQIMRSRGGGQGQALLLTFGRWDQPRPVAIADPVTFYRRP